MAFSTCKFAAGCCPLHFNSFQDELHLAGATAPAGKVGNERDPSGCKWMHAAVLRQGLAVEVQDVHGVFNNSIIDGNTYACQ